MSKYLLNKFLYTIDRDPELVERYRTDPAGTVDWWEQRMANTVPNCIAAERSTWLCFTEAERQALREHDHVTIFQLGAHPFQANAHLHLLEAALAWDELDVDPFWGGLADEIVALALGRFIDPAGGFLREFFDADWRPAAGDDGRAVEPGHQFEWAWLLDRWGRARGDAAARDAARTLFRHGLRGLDPVRGVAVDGLWDDLTVRDPTARLWPQTEHLKAALLFGEDAEVLTAAQGLRRYLEAPARGAWRDKLKADGTFVDEPAPASSFYHVIQAVLPLIAGRSR